METVQSFLRGLYWFAECAWHKVAAKQSKMTPKTYSRLVYALPCIMKMTWDVEAAQPKLGGPGKIVAIDEIFSPRKRSVVEGPGSSCQWTQQIVLGMIEQQMETRVATGMFGC